MLYVQQRIPWDIPHCHAPMSRSPLQVVLANLRPPGAEMQRCRQWHRNSAHWCRFVHQHPVTEGCHGARDLHHSWLWCPLKKKKKHVMLEASSHSNLKWTKSQGMAEKCWTIYFVADLSFAGFVHTIWTCIYWSYIDMFILSLCIEVYTKCSNCIYTTMRIVCISCGAEQLFFFPLFVASPGAILHWFHVPGEQSSPPAHDLK